MSRHRRTSGIRITAVGVLLLVFLAVPGRPASGDALQSRLVADGGLPGDGFASAGAISGSWAIVGAYYDANDNGGNAGAAYLYQRSNADWTQQAKLISTGGDADGFFALSVSMDGAYAIAGAPYDDVAMTYPGGGSSWSRDAGTVRILTRTGSTWTETARLTAPDPFGESHFGWGVSISGDWAIVGARDADYFTSGAGAAYVFHRDGEDWNFVVKLAEPVGGANNSFGASVEIRGDYAIVGATWGEGAAVDSGAAYVFHRNGANWVLQGKLWTSDGSDGDRFGATVAVDGEWAAVGAYGDDDNGSNSGSVYLFRRDGISWAKWATLTPPDAAAGDWFGRHVTLEGNWLAVGAPYADGAELNSGLVYLYRLDADEDEWDLFGTIDSPYLQANGQFGRLVSLDGYSLLIGASGERAAYVYVIPEPGTGLLLGCAGVLLVAAARRGRTERRQLPGRRRGPSQM